MRFTLTAACLSTLLIGMVLAAVTSEKPPYFPTITIDHCGSAAAYRGAPLSSLPRGGARFRG